MLKVIEFIFIMGIIILLCTEFFYPLFSNKPIFGSFRTSKKSNAKSIPEQIETAKKKVKEVKEVQKKVNLRFKNVKDLKKESDELLK